MSSIPLASVPLDQIPAPHDAATTTLVEQLVQWGRRRIEERVPIAYLTGDKLQLVKLYPEGEASCRFPLRGTGVLAAGRRGRDRRGRVAAGLWWAADGAAHRASRARWETRRAREEAGPLGPSPGSWRSGAPCAGRRQAAGWRGVRLKRQARARRSSAGQGGGPAEPIGAFPAHGTRAFGGDSRLQGTGALAVGRRGPGRRARLPLARGAGSSGSGHKGRGTGLHRARSGHGARAIAVQARGAGGRSFPSALSVCPLCRPARLDSVGRRRSEPGRAIPRGCGPARSCVGAVSAWRGTRPFPVRDAVAGDVGTGTGAGGHLPPAGGRETQDASGDIVTAIPRRCWSPVAEAGARSGRLSLGSCVPAGPRVRRFALKSGSRPPGNPARKGRQ